MTGLVLLCFLPILASLTQTEDPGLWKHLSAYVLPSALKNSFLILLGTLAGTSVIGVGLGWMVSRLDFPGRQWLASLLVLPLAVPAYVYAFVYVGLFDYAGPIHSFLRPLWDFSDWLRIHGSSGAVFVLSLALYPYVFLLSREAFSQQPRELFEAAESLGRSSVSRIRQIDLPLAWPWIASALLLVGLEALADFGAVATVNASTLTTALYRVWFGMQSWQGAAQLASFHLLSVLVFLSVFKKLKGRKYPVNAGELASRKRVGLWATVILVTVLLFSVGLPFLQLVVWSLGHWSALDDRYFNYLRNTLLLSASGGFLIVFFASIVSYSERLLDGTKTFLFLLNLGSLGYALPGVIVAVGLVSGVGHLGLLNTNVVWVSLILLVLGYVVRFFMIAFQGLQTRLVRIPRDIDHAAQSLGCNESLTFFKVLLPMMRSSLGVAFVLAFVEIVKEMPMTLMTRPFGWDTLAVRIFEFTSEGQWEQAAPIALTVVVISLFPVWLLNFHSERGS